MGCRVILSSFLLVLVTSFWLTARAGNSGSVAFIEGSSSKYLRNQPVDSDDQKTSISVTEVAGVASVLLGFAPDFSFATESSSKLNKILMPNPFHRPNAVFLLEVSGLNDIDHSQLQVQTVGKYELVGLKASLHLPGEEEVLVTKIEESLDGDCTAACLDKEFTYLATLLEGSYSGSVATKDGILTLPLGNDGALHLHVSRGAELQFTSSLVALVRGIKRAVEFHSDLSGISSNPAELITGRFTGFKALMEEYGNSEIIEQGVQILQITISKMFDLLNRSYGGKIVGVLAYNKEESAMVEVTTSAHISRWLEETSTSTDNSTIAAEVYLVRRSLAWITGIILLISTLLGELNQYCLVCRTYISWQELFIFFFLFGYSLYEVCMLMNMPLTRDTLLYSNVKLD